MNLEEKQIERKNIFEGKVINVYHDRVLLPNGKTAFREIVAHKGGVCVLPITDDNEIILVEQYRYPYSKTVLEIPAGKRDSLEEEPLSAAKRELLEEIGATSDSFTFLGELYPTPGYCGEVIYMYKAENLKFSAPCPDEDEFLNIIKIPFDKALEMVLNGQLRDAKTQTAILKAKLLKDDNK